MERTISNSKGRRRADSSRRRAADSGKSTEQITHDDAPIETVMHYVQMLDRMPSTSSRIPDGEDSLSRIAWTCASCGTLLPRTEELVDTCPHCGAPRLDGPPGAA